MKTSKKLLVIPTTLALMLTSAGVALSASPVIQLAKNFQSDPIVVNGTSGGAIKTQDCGSVAQTPNQTVSIGAAIDYMRISVQAEGEPTLVVQGPEGRFCVLADKTSGEGNPQISGFWPQGTYTIYVGDRAGGQHPYTLSLTKKRN